jgi:hypothetical protein
MSAKAGLTIGEDVTNVDGYCALHAIRIHRAFRDVLYQLCIYLVGRLNSGDVGEFRQSATGNDLAQCGRFDG